MTQGALAAQWFQVEKLTPQLRVHAHVHRHVARGQIWYVLQDRQTGRFFRISPEANLMLQLMDGRRSMAEIWQRVCDRLEAAQPTQDEAVRLLVQLHQSDLLRTALPPDMTELTRRADRQDAARRRGWFTSPMALRFPLFDPDDFLTASMPALRWLFTRTGFVLWLALLATGLVLALLHLPELSANVSDRVFTTYNVVMILLLYPASKALHELGHAYAVKAGGGEVHEIGMMLLVFFPVPYVDATAASAFAERWRRMLVGAAGIMVELALASLAMIAWVQLDPGLARAAAFNLLLLCSVSTLLFNGNPLLRFDGYYVLGDLLEIHNLDTRSQAYLLYLVQRFGFGKRDAENPVRSPGEAKWLASYGVLAFVYRIGVMLGIALLVSQQYFTVGIILAAISVGQMMIWPVLKGARAVLSGASLRARRGRAVGVTVGGIGVVLACLLLVPLPRAILAQGVVWVPDDAVVRARADGFVARILVEPDAAVAAGQPILALEDTVAAAQLQVMRAQLDVASSQYEAVNLIDMVQARLAAQQLARARAALARAEERSRDLLLLAPSGGRFVVPERSHLIGRFVHNGDVLGYVIGAGDIAVRAVVPQAEIDLVRGRTQGVSLRLTEAAGVRVPAVILRQTPSALDHAPAASLSTDGGGPMLLDPASPRHDRPLDRWYEVVVGTPDPLPASRIGGRAFVRFDLGAEPVAWRMLRSLRQTLLQALNV